LSSGRPPAAIAVVRISGPRAGAAFEALIGRIPKPRSAALATVRAINGKGLGEEIDQALALWFPGPHSETGEDTAELQLHGGRAVIAAVLTALGKVEGLRPAEAGEFTRRAFENGKLDLTEVEGLADLVMAETQAQRRQALRHLKGLLGERVESWRERLIAALALVEAGIDFSDEGDVQKQGELVAPALKVVRELSAEIADALIQGDRGERLREGLVVAIAGRPNVGKSTLLNRLARRDAAIVSPYAGTTRDVIEVHLDLEGYPVTLLDTAGVRDADDPVEMEGVRRARARAAEADLVLWLTDCREPALPPEHSSDQAVWTVKTKIDLAPGRSESRISNTEPQFSKTSETIIATTRTEVGFTRNESWFVSRETPEFAISAATGPGTDALVAALARQAEDWLGAGEPALITRERHRVALTAARAALERAQKLQSDQTDLLAEELRLAARALGRLLGRVDVEDVLDVIFRDFCIGK
ncbi:MAG: tRNA uridine-5-carboxymethylaminomethyl(34) synthesis GTPase MnmE, partial [Pseudolabrys sp.]|nr:tRNA uridine-5-carboxymethylaminomethyl(34) synthesis GTPase MnmE [Pseudolabrys sp.]